MKTVCNFTATVLVGAAVIMNFKTGSFVLPVMLGLAASYLADYAKCSLGLDNLRARQKRQVTQNYFVNVSSMSTQTRGNEAAA